MTKVARSHSLAHRALPEASCGEGRLSRRSSLRRSQFAPRRAPRLLLADEPTGQLDQETARATMIALIAWAEAAECALVVATHDEGVAQRFDEIWRMEHGRLTGPTGDGQ